MAGLRLPLLKALTGPLSRKSWVIFTRFRPCYRALSSQASPNPRSARSADNIIHSKHADCQLLGDVTVVQRFFDQATLWPNNIAVECGISGRKYSYGQVRELSRRFGSALARMGFKRNEVLGMILPNLPELPVVLFGATGIGMPVTTVNPIYTAEEIARQMQDCEASVLVCIPQMVDTMKKVAEMCPSIRRMVVLGSSEGFVAIADMFKDSGDLFNDNIQIDVKEDTFFLPYSSGTTGLPKGVMITNHNLTSNIQQFRAPGTTKTVQATDSFQEVFVCVLPFFHIYGMVSIMMMGFDLGAKLVTLPRFEPQSFISTIDKHRPTFVHLVPPLVAFLGQAGWKKEIFERTHSMACGAAPLGPATITRFLDRLDNPDFHMQDVYGMTEGCGMLISPLNDCKIGSSGSTVSRTLAKVVDINTGQVLGPGQEGELCLAGPQVMKGYHKNEKATRESFDSDGFLRTGDIAVCDEDDHIFIVDRLKELIKVKGNQVAPSELEDLLRSHPAVTEAAVIGVEDEKAGELPRAYVITKKGSAASAQEIADFVDGKVASHKQLKGGLFFVDSIPISATGKVLRRQLKALYCQKS